MSWFRGSLRSHLNQRVCGGASATGMRNSCSSYVPRNAVEALERASSKKDRDQFALTSLTESDLHEAGVNGSMADHVLRLGDLACQAGADGLVCSPLEVNVLRKKLGPNPYLVTPGIRSSGEALGDQKRTATAADAIAGGADLLVVGRPIVEAADPHQAALHMLEEVRLANQRRSAS